MKNKKKIKKAEIYFDLSEFFPYFQTPGMTVR